MRKTFGKSMKLSTQKELEKFYIIECGGHAALSLQIHGRQLITGTIVLRSCKGFGRSPPESHEIREMFECC